MNAAHAQPTRRLRITDEDGKAKTRYRKQALRAELCALAVLMGQGLVVVYVIGTLVVNCIRS